jgi:hypothetical protein
MGRIGTAWTTAIAISIATATALGLAGCMQVGGQDFPQATAGFQPKGTYETNIDGAWNAVVAALNANKIGVASSSRETGQITTDYIAGAAEIYGLGLVGGGNSRYRYRIFIARQGKSHTAVTIDCMLENSMTGGIGSGGGSGSFHDVSADNPKLVSNLRNWLYQQIEQKL